MFNRRQRRETAEKITTPPKSPDDYDHHSAWEWADSSVWDQAAIPADAPRKPEAAR